MATPFPRQNCIKRCYVCDGTVRRVPPCHKLTTLSIELVLFSVSIVCLSHCTDRASGRMYDCCLHTVEQFCVERVKSPPTPVRLLVPLHAPFLRRECRSFLAIVGVLRLLVSSYLYTPIYQEKSVLRRDSTVRAPAGDVHRDVFTQYLHFRRGKRENVPCNRLLARALTASTSSVTLYGCNMSHQVNTTMVCRGIDNVCY